MYIIETNFFYLNNLGSETGSIPEGGKPDRDDSCSLQSGRFQPEEGARSDRHHGRRRSRSMKT
jgi:hypothetical protein